MLDLGCGSGRLLRPILDGGARRVVAMDGSPALLRRAALRVERDPVLAAAEREGRLELALGDARHIERRERFSLVVAADVLPHLGGRADADSMLAAVRRRLTPAGRLVLDLPGPGALPERDLPRGVDWERQIDGRRVTRTSELVRREEPDGLHVLLSTMTEVARPDGTFARLPASFALWYPSLEQIESLLDHARLVASLVYGSHDLDTFTPRSERLIVVAERSQEVHSG